MVTRFTAQIYDCKTRSTQTGDKDTRLVLSQSNLSSDILKDLVDLQDTAQNRSRELTIIITDEDLAERAEKDERRD